MNPKQPSQEVNNELSWLSNWLNGRRSQLEENFKSTPTYLTNNRLRINPGGGTTILSNNKLTDNLLPLKGLNKDRVRVNRVIHDQLYNASTAKVDTDPANGIGSYDKESHTIMYNKEDPEYDSSTNIHERTHAMRPIPQIHKVSEIMKNNKYKFTPDESGGYDPRYTSTDYLYNPSEIYGRMNQFRYRNKLKPSTVIDKAFLNSNRNKLLQDDLDIIDDNTLMQLFNNVASNKSNGVTLAKRGCRFNTLELQSFVKDWL